MEPLIILLFLSETKILNEIYAKDPNVSITLIIRQKKMFSNIYNGKTSRSHRVRI